MAARGKGGSWCAASNCRNNYIENKGLSYFRFPKKEALRRVWIKNARREDLLEKDADYCYQNCRLCSMHFEDVMFRSKYRTRLLPKAYPTLFNHTTMDPYIVQSIENPEENENESVYYEVEEVEMLENDYSLIEIVNETETTTKTPEEASKWTKPNILRRLLTQKEKTVKKPETTTDDKKIDYVIIQHSAQSTKVPEKDPLKIGRRITDVHHFFKSLLDVFQHSVVSNCSFGDLNLELEEDDDFNSYANVKCDKCEKRFKISLTESNRSIPDINESIVEAALSTNVKYYTMNSLLYYMSLPIMSREKFDVLSDAITNKKTDMKEKKLKRNTMYNIVYNKKQKIDTNYNVFNS